MSMEKICIGKRGLHEKSDFHHAIEDLNEMITSDVVSEFGKELDTGLIRDLIVGAPNLRKELVAMFDKQSKGMIPYMKRQNEGTRKEILSMLDKVVNDVRFCLNPFDYIPVESYFIEKGEIKAKGVETIFEERDSIYLTNEEQKEVYEKCLEVRKAADELLSMVRRYKVPGGLSNRTFPLDEGLNIRPLAVLECHSKGLFMQG